MVFKWSQPTQLYAQSNQLSCLSHTHIQLAITQTNDKRWRFCMEWSCCWYCRCRRHLLCVFWLCLFEKFSHQFYSVAHHPQITWMFPAPMTLSSYFHLLMIVANIKLEEMCGRLNICCLDEIYIFFHTSSSTFSYFFFVIVYNYNRSIFVLSNQM